MTTHNKKINWKIDATRNIDVLLQPLRWKKPHLINVGSDFDLFDGSVPERFIDEVFAIMAIADHHRFKVLTRFPDNMRRYLTNELRHEHIGLCNEGFATPDWVQDNWPLNNVWLGVSIEDQRSADERIPTLLKTPAALRWVSAEPLAGADDTPSQ